MARPRGSLKLDLTGKVFGRLTVLRRGADQWYQVKHRLVPQVRWDCRCACGKLTTQPTDPLHRGLVVSCGCFNRDQKRTHGMEGTRIYDVWASMLQRCRNPKHRAYPRYGGRGITVCRRWYRFENFYADMGEPPSAKSRRLVLDRIDNDKGYTPGNCRWTTYSVSNSNQERYLK